MPITPLPLTPTKEDADRSVVHSLLRIEDQPIGGLVNGVVYFVVNSTAGTFQLAATQGGAALSLEPKDAVSGQTLTGNSTLGTEGVDLSIATGGGTQLVEQQLAIDITSTFSGTHRLDGVGGTLGLAGVRRAMASSPRPPAVPAVAWSAFPVG